MHSNEKEKKLLIFHYKVISNIKSIEDALPSQVQTYYQQMFNMIMYKFKVMIYKFIVIMYRFSVIMYNVYVQCDNE